MLTISFIPGITVGLEYGYDEDDNFYTCLSLGLIRFTFFQTNEDEGEEY